MMLSQRWKSVLYQKRLVKCTREPRLEASGREGRESNKRSGFIWWWLSCIARIGSVVIQVLDTLITFLQYWIWICLVMDFTMSSG